MSDSTPRWYDDEAGPMVRLYAMTAGRARPSSEAFALMAVVQAESRPATGNPPALSPEQRAILALCGERPRPVAEIASDSGLPLGVVRVLLSDLLAAELICVNRPVPPAQLPATHLLKEVIDGLRAL
ncbi:DUF742 domain-containing protein [Streptomyces natalensis]|uniref:Multi-component regulatory system-11 n=1 Tax=Streptomyces natalensis ATCC 27448 TaxID=1240678 RepID=A0A0D7CME2_9ACTN|nr:DUF742 domain-containing protein [Streptomyces natalensis]KIZ17221.1 hypothetical protein SNA_14400 [Streptomyces natalensis ATCC 27448]